MRLKIVLLTHIDNLPPARSLLLALVSKDIQVELITMYSSALPKEIKDASNIKIIDVQQDPSPNKMQALINRIKRRTTVRKLLEETDEKDVIWTVTDYDAMEAGPVLLSHRHVMQLMELIKDIPYFDELPLFKANIAKYARNAELIIVPEYNRAHIQKAYWQLHDTPEILPNKPNVKTRDLSLSYEAEKVLDKIGDRKIVLYQGTFGYERVLDQFIEAVYSLGDQYCMLLMGREDDELRKLRKRYDKTFFIPFIPAPDHLAVTEKAHIGVLSYVNTAGIRYYDPLNAIYCAPNKLYEYAAFGIPMIGNDIPGLELPFKMHNIGRCAKLDSESIAKAINNIEVGYTEMSHNCLEFYRSVDYDRKVLNIIDELKENSKMRIGGV